jgi:D-alanine--poly(phosphoribitol) ligase subunit 1
VDLLDRIDAWSRKCPERLAYVSASGSLSWRTLAEQSDALAGFLAAETGGRGPVAVFGHKETGMLPAFLGCLKAGHAYVPIDVSLPPDRVRRIVVSSGAALVLSPAELPAELRVPGVRVVDGPKFAEAIAGARRADRELRVRGDEDVYVIYTSGSTGDPKGVRITLEALTTFIDWMLAEQQPAETAEVYLNQAPFSFDLSVMDLYMSLATGGTLWSADRDMIANPARLFAALRESGITTWVSTPLFAEMCLAEPSFDPAMLPGMRRFLFDGEVLPNDTAARLFERFPGARVWNLYGPTEATVAITSVAVTPELLAEHRPLPVGRVAPGSRIALVGEDGFERDGDAAGEIVIAGPTVSVGYLGDPERTAARFCLDEATGHRAYRTGDAGHRLGDLLFYDGRLDFQVKVHGYRIELGDVEANVSRLPEVANCVVLPVLRDGRAQYLKAHVLLAAEMPGTDLERAAHLRRRLAELVPDYMVPRRFAFVDAFPMTPNGKIDRRALAGGGA